MDKKELLITIISDLKGKRFIKTQKDFANKIGINITNLSSAVNGDEKYLTENLFDKIKNTFPEFTDLINNNQSNAGNINITGDNNGVANIGRIGGGFTINNNNERCTEQADKLEVKYDDSNADVISILKKQIEAQNQQLQEKDKMINSLLDIIKGK